MRIVYGGVGAQVPPRRLSQDGIPFYGQVGPFEANLIPDSGGIVTVTVVATDSHGLSSQPLNGNDINLLKCSPG